MPSVWFFIVQQTVIIKDLLVFYCRFYDIVLSFIENQDDAVVDLEADVQQATINVSYSVPK